MNTFKIATILDKAQSNDSDIRFMATNDLNNALPKDSFALSDQEETSVVNAVLNLIRDVNSEVQNLALKALGNLEKKLKDKSIIIVFDSLLKSIDDPEDSVRDVSAVALKTCLLELANTKISNNTRDSILSSLSKKLILKSKVENSSQLDVIDIIAEVLAKFGKHLVNVKWDNKKETIPQAIQSALLPLLSSKRPAIRKRTTQAIGNLVLSIDDKLFNSLLSFITKELKQKGGAKDYEQVRTLLSCVSNIAKYDSKKLGDHLNVIFPFLSTFIAIEEEDELKEVCLQALEIFVLRLPSKIAPSLNDIIEIALKYLKHDPNYGADDDDVEMDDEDKMDEDEEEEEDVEEYSDDEDMSWKVRKASSKLLSAIIGTRPELLSQLLDSVAPTLILRFNEREENVRIDVLNTFTALIKISRTLVSHKGSLETSSDSSILLSKLSQLVPNLSGRLSKQLNGKSIQSRQTGFTLLRELVLTLGGGLGDQFGLFVPSIDSSLSSAIKAGGVTATPSMTNSNLKIETLLFLKTCFQFHSADVFYPFLEKLVPSILEASKEKYYKIKSEALLVLVEVVKILRPFPGSPEERIPKFEDKKMISSINIIFNQVIDVLNTSDADLEVKERSVLLLGTLFAQAGDVLDANKVQKEAFPLFLERLRNELTKMISINVLKAVLSGRLTLNSENGGVNLNLILLDLVTELIGNLKKNNTQWKVGSLQTLQSFLKVYAKFLPQKTFQLISVELKSILMDSEVPAFPLVISLLIEVIEGSGGEVCGYINSDLVPLIVEVIVTSPHLLGSETAIEVLRMFLGVDVKYSSTGSPKKIEVVCKDLVGLFREGVVSKPSTASKSVYSVVSKCIVAILLAAETVRDSYIEALYSEICSDPLAKGKVKSGDLAKIEASRYLSLLVIGEMGRHIDISLILKNIDKTLLDLLSSSVEDIRQCSAVALGSIALGNLEKYMPVLLSAIKEGGKNLYLLFVTLREVVSSGSKKINSTTYNELSKYSIELWKLLFINVDSELDEGTRNVLSECLGKLCLHNPTNFLNEMKANLSSKSIHARQTVVTALRYTFHGKTFEESEGGKDASKIVEAFDVLLSPILVDFLKLINDENLLVRRAALSTLNSAAHQKPYLVRKLLTEILPLLYQETIIKPELIYIVEMGPFKHTVDDGLDARKAAFDCMATILDTCPSGIEINEFLNVIVLGIRDTASEVKVLCYQIIQKLCALTPTAVLQRLDDMAEPLKETILFEVKENAVKQEKEKNDDLVKNTVKLACVLVKLANGTSIVGGKFGEFQKDVLENERISIAEVIKICKAELDSQGATSMGLKRGADEMIID